MSVRPPHPRTLLLVALAAAATLLWAGCAHRAPTPEPAAPAEAGPYVGSDTCRPCHAEIFARQSASHHAATLGPVTPQWAQGKFDESKWITDRESGIQYGVAERPDGYYQVLSQDGKVLRTARIDYLLGSGHHGVSPMTLDGDQWRYLSLTYYAAKGWDFSPMHRLGTREERLHNAQGWPVSAEELRKCFGCHSVRVEFAGSRLDPARTELGVRCEACHGPGRAHLEAVQAKSTDLKITNPAHWSTRSFLALCQQCHNENSSLDGTMFGIPKDPRSPALAKFQVYELEQSRCFKESGEKLRCTTCHDPHGNTEPSPAYYTAKCLSCHQPHTAGAKPCPVNPTNGCVTCHMPPARVEQHTLFADHWIRARSPFAPRASSRSRE